MSFDRNQVTGEMLDSVIRKLSSELDDLTALPMWEGWSKELEIAIGESSKMSGCDLLHTRFAVLMGIDIGLKLADEMVKLEQRKTVQ